MSNIRNFKHSKIGEIKFSIEDACHTLTDVYDIHQMFKNYPDKLVARIFGDGVTFSDLTSDQKNVKIDLRYIYSKMGIEYALSCLVLFQHETTLDLLVDMARTIKSRYSLKLGDNVKFANQIIDGLLEFGMGRIGSLELYEITELRYDHKMEVYCKDILDGISDMCHQDSYWLFYNHIRSAAYWIGYCQEKEKQSLGGEDGNEACEDAGRTEQKTMLHIIENAFLKNL